MATSTISKKNILDIYRLEDNDGTEITLEQLADKYSNPEICFTLDERSDYIKMIAINSILLRVNQEKIFKIPLPLSPNISPNNLSSNDENTAKQVSKVEL